MLEFLFFRDAAADAHRHGDTLLLLLMLLLLAPPLPPPPCRYRHRHRFQHHYQHDDLVVIILAAEAIAIEATTRLVDDGNDNQDGDSRISAMGCSHNQHDHHTHSNTPDSHDNQPFANACIAFWMLLAEWKPKSCETDGAETVKAAKSSAANNKDDNLVTSQGYGTAQRGTARRLASRIAEFVSS